MNDVMRGLKWSELDYLRRQRNNNLLTLDSEKDCCSQLGSSLIILHSTDGMFLKRNFVYESSVQLNRKGRKMLYNGCS